MSREHAQLQGLGSPVAAHGGVGPCLDDFH
jgi:hypothetical protein